MTLQASSTLRREAYQVEIYDTETGEQTANVTTYNRDTLLYIIAAHDGQRAMIVTAVSPKTGYRPMRYLKEPNSQQWHIIIQRHDTRNGKRHATA